MKDITTAQKVHEVETGNANLVKAFWTLLEAHRDVFKQDRTFMRMCLLAVGTIFAFARHTVTQGICAIGQGQKDHSAWYRLFSKSRWDETEIAWRFALQTFKHVQIEEAYVTGVDTTPIIRSSKKMPGSSWGLSPRTAPFKKGLHRVQRFLHCAWLPGIVDGYTRAIPLRFLPAFTPKAIASSAEPKKDWEAALDFAKWLRELLDGVKRQAQPLVIVADGAFDKAELWRALPDRVTLIVRTAKNRVLRGMPGVQIGRGRRRLYGAKAPSPEQVLHERGTWHFTVLNIRGRMIKMRYKLRGCYLRQTVPNCPVFLLVIGGETYKAGKRKPRIVHREPAFFLIRAGLRNNTWVLPFSEELILQWVWQRWELEVTHRELKTSFGVGQMQCWNKFSAILSVQWMVWVYAVMMLAGYRTWGWFGAPAIQTRWWRGAKRWSFTTLWSQLRSGFWNLDEFKAVCLGSAPNSLKFDLAWLALARAAAFSSRG